MTVYADLLFIVNLYIDALLLSAVRRFLRLPLTGKRLLLASVARRGVWAFRPAARAAGGCFVSADAVGIACAVRGGVCAKADDAAFKSRFFAVFVWRGAFRAFDGCGVFSADTRHLLANGAVYFNISALTLILLTCVSYGVLYGFDRLFRKKEPDVFFAKLTITRQGKTVTLPAKIDTGLTLTEPFSGTPAIVADRCALGDILPPNFGMQSTENAVSMRLIPFSSLGADGVLPAFQPDAASLSGISIECWVAVTDRTLSAGSFQALVAPPCVTPRRYRV